LKKGIKFALLFFFKNKFNIRFFFCCAVVANLKRSLTVSIIDFFRKAIPHKKTEKKDFLKTEKNKTNFQKKGIVVFAILFVSRLS
jgi:hypothetical protein